MKLLTKNKKLMYSVICLAITFSLFIYFLSNGFRRNPEEIQRKLLMEFPLGSKMEQVEKKLIEKGSVPQVSRNAGFLKQQKGDSVVIGSQSIRAHLGDYRSSIFLVTSVTAFFAFNDKDDLIDIWVWKTTDGP